MQFTFAAIGQIHSDYKQKFGIPRQTGLCPSGSAKIEIFAPFNRPEAFAELQQCSHIWVQFVFHENKRNTWKPKVKAPRLGGNKSIGVFATRAPIRPNPIGLSVVKLEAIESLPTGLFLRISGGDFLHATPVLDIKPYVPYCDKIDNAVNHFADAAPTRCYVEITPRGQEKLRVFAEPQLEQNLREVLQLNPAPQYQKPSREKLYALQLSHYDIHWRRISDDTIEVIDIVDLEEHSEKPD